MPIATTQEQQALQASLRDWAKRTDPIAVVRQGPSTALLADLTALGVFAIPLDGGTVTDLAAALEQLACILAPGPVLPTALRVTGGTGPVCGPPATCSPPPSPPTPLPVTGTRGSC